MANIKMVPMLRRYRILKGQYLDMLLVFRLGDLHNPYEDNASPDPCKASVIPMSPQLCGVAGLQPWSNSVDVSGHAAPLLIKVEGMIEGGEYG